MRKLLIPLLIAIMAAGSACSQDEPLQSKQSDRHDGLVFIKGGTFTNTKSNFFGKSERISDFYIGQYEVTQQEWTEVMGHNPSAFQGDGLPVEMVSWYDAVEYCNLRSIKEGLMPYYHIDKGKKDPNNRSEHDNLKWTVTIDPEADGYRLPTEAEWEYAASGGQQSKGYTYSGSSDADEAAWYWRNAGDKYLSGDWNWPIIENNRNRTKAVGLKKPNELGLYDMSGNVREWCWNWYGDSLDSSSGSYRVVKGGGWIGGLINNAVSYRGKFEANGFGPDQGFRVVRSG
ncbi:formylglycine-generating enzyme family protein [Paenibacillus tarimensis]|uniref:formylglycine-generating enzyme family protein n=1 Tax=Paenibacillus tarimensis TaxID=416012 RepID=UPI001F4899D3|nr:SUMF1/EgtB/PvdO family nonheme iron enzyme [Paenibacillus tarimensis]MCF2943593.1 formylglycine-generating enzyme family protein [Paenibacillus tarimensis]